MTTQAQNHIPIDTGGETLFCPVTVEFLEEHCLYLVSCPWLQGSRAWRETLDEALKGIPGNIRATLQARAEKGPPLPELLKELDRTRPFTLRLALA